jgi:hypothetical protein
VDFFFHRFDRPCLLNGGCYVDGVDSSAVELRATRVDAPHWNSMDARRKAPDFVLRSVRLAGNSSDGAIHEPAERKRF